MKLFKSIVIIAAALAGSAQARTDLTLQLGKVNDLCEMLYPTKPSFPGGVIYPHPLNPVMPCSPVRDNYGEFLPVTWIPTTEIVEALRKCNNIYRKVVIYFVDKEITYGPQ